MSEFHRLIVVIRGPKAFVQRDTEISQGAGASADEPVYSVATSPTELAEAQKARSGPLVTTAEWPPPAPTVSGGRRRKRP